MLHPWGATVQTLSSAVQIRKLAIAFALGQALVLAFFVAGTHGMLDRKTNPATITTDFVSFYAAGALADAGRAADAYDHDKHRAAEEAARAPGIGYQTFLYPPTFMLLCAPLATLPYLLAVVAFDAVTGLFWLVAATRVAGGGATAAWVLLAVPSVYWALGEGQNSFLSAGLMALGTLLLARRPWSAGAAFGAICFKPHLGLVIPVALLAGRQYRAAAGAAAMVIGMVAASLLLFGAGAWRGYLTMVLHLHDTVEGKDIQFFGHVDGYGMARLAGLDQGSAQFVQLAIGCIALVIVAALWWRRSTPEEARYAALASGVLMVTPFALFYDLLMTAVAGAWLVRAGRRHGFLPGEKEGLAAAFLIDLASYPVAKGTGIALGALVAPLLLGLATRRAFEGKTFFFEKKNQKTFTSLG